MPSFVWNYFTKLESDKARCNQKCCKTVISHSKGTHGLIYHLKTAHNIMDNPAPAKRIATDTPETAKRQKTMFDYCNKPTLEEEVAKLIAKSNLSFNQVARTEFIRQSLATKYPGRIIPQDGQGMSSLMMKFFEIAEEETKDKIKKLKDDGKKFSVTLDEWTSTSNCRYLNINIHYTVSAEGKTSFFNLGLLKIKGKCTAEILVIMVSIIDL